MVTTVPRSDEMEVERETRLCKVDLLRPLAEMMIVVVTRMLACDVVLQLWKVSSR
jgi:hypothetical protein